ncbi:MAG: hypothetical protein J6T12_03920 [Salinivirgaceae bacterium]|nr:hypothetical protein [Salinivirgaceae bacterium]
MRIRTILIVASAVLFQACGNTDKTGVSGTMETKSCAADTSIHYTVYTPQTNDGKMPAIIFFDPHSQGYLPVEAYAKLADKYGYVLFGSNDLRNGMTAGETEKIVRGMVGEVLSQGLVDTKRVYLSGFSGGAKIAMLYGLNMPEIHGVAACGGSVNPTARPDSTFCYVSLVGNCDFNYHDMQQSLALFSNMQLPFTSVVFDGKHEWPSAATYETVFQAFDINAMHFGLKPTDVKWLKTVYAAMSDSVSAYLSEGRFIKASEMLLRIEGWYGSLDKDIRLSSYMSNLSESPVFASQLKKMQEMSLKEIHLRGQFIGSIENRDLDWWKNEVENFEKSIASKDEQVSVASKRLMAYLSMVTYSLANSDILNNNAEKAYKKLKIYELVDPENPGVYLMFARYYLMINDRASMVESYNKAISMGFNDFAQYESDPAWRTLFAQPELVRK